MHNKENKAKMRNLISPLFLFLFYLDNNVLRGMSDSGDIVGQLHGHNPLASVDMGGENGS